MENKLLIVIFSVFCFLSFISIEIIFASPTEGTINANYKNAWADQAGWMNFGCDNCNVQIGDSTISGYIWNENYGWIDLSPVQSGVRNDSNGNLSGFAFGANAGWIDFNNVAINTAGEFTGTASGDNIGTIVFQNCGNSCRVATDWRPVSERGQSGGAIYSNTLPITLVQPSLPVEPEGGFSVVINNGDEKTRDRAVELTFIAGIDTTFVEISSEPSFQNTSLETFENRKKYNFPEGEGVKVIYVKFYNDARQSSPIATDSIVLDTTPPLLSIDSIKQFDFDENVIVSGKSEAEAEIFLCYDQKCSFVTAEGNGAWKANFGIFSPGVHGINIMAKDDIGNYTNLSVNVKINEEPKELERQDQFKTPFALLPKTINYIRKNLGEKIKRIISYKELPTSVVVPKEAPASLSGKWNLLPAKPI